MKRPSGVLKEKSFLNVVEEFAVAALGLAAVGNIFQHMNGLQPFAGCASARAKSKPDRCGRARDAQIHPNLRPWSGRRAGIGLAAFAGQGQQRAHVDADQFAGGYADHGGQGAVDPQNFVGLVVHHDEIGDGVEDLHPVAVGLLDAGKQAGVFQRHGGVTGHGFQEDRDLPAPDGRARPERQSSPANSPFEPGQAHHRCNHSSPESWPASAPSRSAALPGDNASRASSSRKESAQVAVGRPDPRRESRRPSDRRRRTAAPP